MLSGGVRTCKHCKQDGHTAFHCPSKPRAQLKARKPIKRVGKLGKKYITLREQYFQDHPGDEHYCYYCLYVGMEQPLTRKQTQVEHYYSKARHPERRFDKTNLVAACSGHNKLKGSLDGPEFLQLLDESKENQ